MDERQNNSSRADVIAAKRNPLLTYTLLCTHCVWFTLRDLPSPVSTDCSTCTAPAPETDSTLCLLSPSLFVCMCMYVCACAFFCSKYFSPQNNNSLAPCFVLNSCVCVCRHKPHRHVEVRGQPLEGTSLLPLRVPETEPIGQLEQDALYTYSGLSRPLAPDSSLWLM